MPTDFNRLNRSARNALVQWRRLLGAAVLSLVLLTGCTHSARHTGSVLRYPLGAEPSSVDPVMVTDPDSLELWQNVYEGIVQFDKQNRIVPCLADRWEISQDGKVYTFHIRLNAKFHNGRLMVADDVKYSFERALWKETRAPVAATYLAGIAGADDVAAGRTRELAGVRIADPHTVVITLTRPRGYFLGQLAYNTAWIFCKEVIDRTGGHVDERSAIGTGPFKLTEYRRGGKVVLAANRDYWGGPPKVDWIERPIVLDGEVAHIKYQSGELDECLDSFSDYVVDRTDPVLSKELRFGPLAAVSYLAMGETAGSPFRDIRVRQAFARAIDRDRLVQVAYYGVRQPADGFLPPGIPGYNPSFPHIPFDPAAARRLLAEAGYAGGRGFPRQTLVFYQQDKQYAAVASVIREDLHTNLGVDVDLEQREQAEFLDAARAKKLPFHLNTWYADYLDPQDFLPTLLRTGAAVNRWAYSNPEFDRLCDAAEAEPNEQRRIDLYRQADRIAMADVALLPLTYVRGAVLTKPYVHGFDFNLMGNLPLVNARVDAH